MDVLLRFFYFDVPRASCEVALTGLQAIRLVGDLPHRLSWCQVPALFSQGSGLYNLKENLKRMCIV
jgi:hypothetical protein